MPFSGWTELLASSLTRGSFRYLPARLEPVEALPEGGELLLEPRLLLLDGVFNLSKARREGDTVVGQLAPEGVVVVTGLDLGTTVAREHARHLLEAAVEHDRHGNGDAEGDDRDDDADDD